MKPTIVFDVNETLLSLAPVRSWFAERFGNEPDASNWFGELLRLSFVSAATNRYIPFPELGAAALSTVAERCGAAVGDDDLFHIGEVFTTLPPHRDVVEGLESLRDAGFTTVALTNSPKTTAKAQLHNAGIAPLFDSILSVEMVKRFKPHRSVYGAAAASLGVSTREMTMVAAHDWDVAGAMAAGCGGVFVSRRGQSYSTAFAPPTAIAMDILDAANQIIASQAS